MKRFLSFFSKAEKPKPLAEKPDSLEENPELLAEEPDSFKDDPMKLIVSAATNTGNVRPKNEDSFYADGIERKDNVDGAWQTELTQKQAFFAVCDGMGGESFGKEASCIAVTVLAEYRNAVKSTELFDVLEWVNRYVKEANHQICEMAFREHCRISGSTLAFVYIDQGVVSVFHIGDSRVYYYHSGKLQQITEDQTLAMKKLKANIYTEEEARNSPDSHKITSFLGVDTREVGLKAVAQEPFPLADGMLLICSDGLTDMCTDTEIEEILQTKTSSLAEALVNKALENGGEDNVTCVVIYPHRKVIECGNS